MRRLWTVAALVLAALPAFAADVPAPVAEVGRKLAAGDYKGVTAGMVSRDGEVLFEAYAPGHGAKERHDIRSATKSITAILVGDLVADGSLKSVNTKISDILPDLFAHMPAGDDRRDITVEDALTMRTGLACDDWSPASVGHEDKMYKTRDWMAFLLSQPLAYEVGKQFSYCTGGVVLLGRVIEKLAGMPVPKYADERLFGPLGIDGARWRDTPTGHTDTGGHIRLTLGDLHSLGRLMLAGGDWQGKRLIARDWFEAMTRVQTTVPGRGEKYGYLWWLNSGEVAGKPVSIMFAHGNGGNFILVVPELGLVGAFTGTNFGKPEQMVPLQVFTREIVPALVRAK
ncbi:MAG: class C beta-lactamase-related serine hydrolase [Alphaproteobacteria bacterium]|nr:MAG: class C beta-lactamase-related serine hydrolase [Alphaproteobacteria bacterium]